MERKIIPSSSLRDGSLNVHIVDAEAVLDETEMPLEGHQDAFKRSRPIYLGSIPGHGSIAYHL